jgi:4-aminobutyrate aminotransferase-like enzyme
VNDVTPSAIRLCPPLVVGESDCDEAVGILDGILGSIGREAGEGQG